MKVVVAHPERQHSLETAGALFLHGHLERYLTTVYCGDRSLTKMLSRLLPAKYKAKALGRRSEFFSDEFVMQFCEAQALLKLLCQNISLFRFMYSGIRYRNSDVFAARAAHYAIEHGADVVIGYDNTSPLLYEILKREAPSVVRIQDMTALNTLYMKPIYERDLAKSPDFADMLKSEQSRVWDERQLDRKRRELASAQYFLCASEVTRRSLTYSGIHGGQCLMLPYGVDTGLFACKEWASVSYPIKFVYVGGTKELKGISYLLNAFINIDPDLASLTVVGSNNLSHSLNERYYGRVTFANTVPHNRLPELLRSMDVMVFPSLGDGFGLAALEGMSCGLPLICTDKSGVCDFVEDGVNGYVVPIQDERAIAERALMLVENPDLIVPMGRKARKMAETLSWERYGDSLCRMLQEVVEETGTHA